MDAPELPTDLRMGVIDPPEINRPAAETAIQAYLEGLAQPFRRVRWIVDPRAAFESVEDALRCPAWDAATKGIPKSPLSSTYCLEISRTRRRVTIAVTDLLWSRSRKKRRERPCQVGIDWPGGSYSGVIKVKNTWLEAWGSAFHAAVDTVPKAAPPEGISAGPFVWETVADGLRGAVQRSVVDVVHDAFWFGGPSPGHAEAFSAGVGWFIVLPEEVVAVPRPVLHLDEQERLHNEDGPAAYWRGGIKLHAQHGVVVPAEIVKIPKA